MNPEASPVTYAEAAAEAARYQRLVEQPGVVVVCAGREVRGFEFWPEAQQIDVAMTDDLCEPFHRPHWSLSIPAFRAHWEARLKVYDERVRVEASWAHLESDLLIAGMRMEQFQEQRLHGKRPGRKRLQAMAQEFARLAALCRVLDEQE